MNLWHALGLLDLTSQIVCFLVALALAVNVRVFGIVSMVFIVIHMMFGAHS